MALFDYFDKLFDFLARQGKNEKDKEFMVIGGTGLLGALMFFQVIPDLINAKSDVLVTLGIALIALTIITFIDAGDTFVKTAKT